MNLAEALTQLPIDGRVVINAPFIDFQIEDADFCLSQVQNDAPELLTREVVRICSTFVDEYRETYCAICIVVED